MAASMRTMRKLSQNAKSLARSFCDKGSLGKEGDITSIPLSKAPSSFPKPIYATPGDSQYETKVTTLKNGLRVASENKFGKYSTVGVLVDSGSRYEVAYPSGVSHYLEKLAFMSTSDFKSREEIMSLLEKYGGICDCQGSRDTLIYAVSADTKGLPKMIHLLSEVVLKPKIQLHEMEEARQTIAFELEDLELAANQEATLNEMIHAAAYVDNTLGLPKICPRNIVLDKIMDRKVLFTYLRHHFRPDRMVLAGVGCDHDLLCELAEKYFVEEGAPVWEDDRYVDGVLACSKKEWTHDFSSRMFNKNLADRSVAQYTGGYTKIVKDLSHLMQGPNPLPELVHYVIGLESCSHRSDDFVATCVLNMLMGGGGSFSAGGPGKGMYTRLYTNVLNRYSWMFSATAYNQAYSDSGLFYIIGSSQPQHLSQLVQVITGEMRAMAGDVSEVELSRAKRQLQSMLLMNLESRPVVFEDIGRQVLSTGRRKPPLYYLDAIERITSEDVQRVASKMLETKAAVAALGKCDSLPSYQTIEGLLAAGGGGGSGQSAGGMSTRLMSFFNR